MINQLTQEVDGYITKALDWLKVHLFELISDVKAQGTSEHKQLVREILQEALRRLEDE